MDRGHVAGNKENTRWRGASRSGGGLRLLSVPRSCREEDGEFCGEDEKGKPKTDIKNPNAGEGFEHMPPEQLVENILEKEKRISEIIAEIKETLRQP